MVKQQSNLLQWLWPLLVYNVCNSVLLTWPSLRPLIIRHTTRKL